MRSAPRLLLGAAATVLAATAVVAPAAQAAAGKPPTTESVLHGYAADTWQSMAAMVDPGTGLVSDNVGGDLAAGDRAAYTSPTNIGAYMWSAIAARDIGIITSADA